MQVLSHFRHDFFVHYHIFGTTFLHFHHILGTTFSKRGYNPCHTLFPITAETYYFALPIFFILSTCSFTTASVLASVTKTELSPCASCAGSPV